jgi:hypothetical protein
MAERKFLTYEEAVSILPDSEEIHIFNNVSGMLIGCDWSRAEILDKLSKSEVIELTGDTARGMGHGIAAYNKDTKYQRDVLFIQTDEEKLSAFEKEKDNG